MNTPSPTTSRGEVIRNATLERMRIAQEIAERKAQAAEHIAEQRLQAAALKHKAAASVDDDFATRRAEIASLVQAARAEVADLIQATASELRDSNAATILKRFLDLASSLR